MIPNPGKRLLLLAGLLACLAYPCFAGPIYNVSIDTTLAAGSNGAIYLQFNGGLNPDPASVVISNFAIAVPGTLLNSPAPSFMGDVTGALDNLPLTITNTYANNDYLHFVTFGGGLSFQVAFVVPSVLLGDSGSTFSFGLTASDGLSPILTYDPSGFIGQISYDEQGIYTETLLSDKGTITNAVPEPATITLLGMGLAGYLFRRRRP